MLSLSNGAERAKADKLDIEGVVTYIGIKMAKSVRDEIIEQVDHLDDPQRRRVLEFARQLTAPSGTPGADLMRFAGSIDQADLQAMSQAIQEACENIEPDAW